MKKNKTLLIITTALCLLPIALGLLLWNRLPEQIPVHWNFQGEADRTAGKASAVFFLPAVITAVHLLCAFVTRNDPKHSVIPDKIMGLVLWICPLLSIFTSFLTYTAAFGLSLNANLVMSIFLGLLLISVGSYLPECPHNYTIGIKLPWTLADEDNWKKTHALAGPLWIAGGFAMILTSFLNIQSANLLILILIAIAVIPAVYSWRLYKKKSADGKAE
ncbi:MAG: SdpI family protein [Solobacterium sp.]|nr:SdpI family protein [Solobacterium sp.]